jgi:hypothetical protein
MGWYELGLVTKDERYYALYRNLLATSLASHAAFLPGVDTEIPVMDRLHAYSYFLEGLLPVVQERACADAMAEGIDRAAAFVRKISPVFLRSDVVAQLLRARLFADQHGVAPLDEDVAKEEVATLQSFQSDDSDVHLNGGFWFGRKNGSLLPFMNPVSTVFCTQTIEMWNRYRKGHRALHWQSLV